VKFEEFQRARTRGRAAFSSAQPRARSRPLAAIVIATLGFCRKYAQDLRAKTYYDSVGIVAGEEFNTRIFERYDHCVDKAVV